MPHKFRCSEQSTELLPLDKHLRITNTRQDDGGIDSPEDRRATDPPKDHNVNCWHQNYRRHVISDWTECIKYL